MAGKSTCPDLWVSCVRTTGCLAERHTRYHPCDVRHGLGEAARGGVGDNIEFELAEASRGYQGGHAEIDRFLRGRREKAHGFEV